MGRIPRCAARAVFSLTLFMLGSVAADAHATVRPPEQILHAADSGAVFNYGFAVAIDGDTAMVSGNLADNGIATGIVEVWVRNRRGHWVYDSTLLPPPTEQFPNAFGWRLALSGNVVLVGVQGGGEAHVFRRIQSEWRYEQTLSGPNIGTAFDVDGRTAVFGGNNAVQVYRLQANGLFELSQTLTPSGETPTPTGPKFGAAVALDRDTLLVGAPAALANGAAYVFRRFDGHEWVQTQKLVPGVPTISPSFGANVALEDRLAVIGSPFEDPVPPINTTRAGAAYVYVRSGGVWIEQDRLTSPNESIFGLAVAVADRHILVQEQTGVILALQINRVLQFDRVAGEWTAVATFTRGQGLTAFGGGIGRFSSLAASDSTALIGASAVDDFVGVSFIYDLDPRRHHGHHPHY